MNKHLNIFWSKGFIIGLLILLINDHILKAQLDNWLTGKLSDLAGLFIFPIFFATFLPKYKKHIFWITALGFIWFKSPMASGPIEVWNNLAILNISRVIDYTDLFALIMLPLSYSYFISYKPVQLKLNPLPVIVITSFGFIATSRSPMAEVQFNKEYSFQYSIDTLKKKIFFHPNIINNNTNRETWNRLDSLEHDSIVYPKKHIEKRKKELMDSYCNTSIYIEVEDSDHICGHEVVRISIHQNREISKLKLLDVRYRHCNHVEGKEDKDILQEIFEAKIIQPLNK